MITISESWTRILEYLHRYKFLTGKQFVKLGCYKSTQALWRVLREMRTFPNEKKPIVDVITFPAMLRVEHVEKIYYLTEYGANLLADILCIDPSELDFQRVTSSYHRDYWHRWHTVNAHIYIDRALKNDPLCTEKELEVVTWERYFDKIGANRKKDNSVGMLRSKTRIDFEDGEFYIIPDVNFVIEAFGDSDKQALFSLETCHGRNTKRILHQIYKHSFCMQEGALGRKYAAETDYSALFIFTSRGTMEKVKERYFENERMEGFTDSFYFAHVDDMEQDPLNCWGKADEEGFFNFITGKQVQ